MTYSSIYDAVRDNYERDGMWERMLHAGEPESFNLAEEALGRHAGSDEVALRIRDFETGETEQHTFSELDDEANHAANFFESTMARGERFGVLLQPRLELYASIFGGIKSHRIFVPMDTKFGPDAVSYRLDEAGATTLVTVPEKLDAVDTDAVPSLERVVLVHGDAEEREHDLEGVEVVSYGGSVGEQPDGYEAMRMHPMRVYSIGYSSGTTGQPSQQFSTHAKCVGIEPYLKFVVDLQPDDVYFVAASPAWAYGLTLGTLSPGLKGAPIGAYRGHFDVERWVETLDEWGVTNAMVAPTALRQLRSGDVDVEGYDVDLRVLITAGESMDEGTSDWCHENLGTPPLDAYGLSEGGMLVCNYPFPDWEVKPGSMGKPLPGYEVALADPSSVEDEEVAGGDEGVRGDSKGDADAVLGEGFVPPETEDETVDEIVEVEEPGKVGEVAVKQQGLGGPLEGLRETGGWLLTGDLAERDEDGYWWYRGRADEVIISAGYRIGPEEVEKTLVKHDAVAETAVVGVPDETRGNIVKAYVSTASGFSEGSEDEELRESIVRFAKQELSKHEYPRKVEFVDELPKTASDKVHRRKLKEREEKTDDNDQTTQK